MNAKTVVKRLLNGNETPLLAKFRRRLNGKTLGHATDPKFAKLIRQKGLVEELNYFNTDDGWYDKQDSSCVVLVKARNVAVNAIPDIEDFSGDIDIDWKGKLHSVGNALQLVGRQALEQKIEEFFGGKAEEYFDDTTDPENWNICVMQKIPPAMISAIRS